MYMLFKKPFLYLSVLFFISTFQLSQAQKKPLTIDDYPQWKSLAQPSLSDNGQWLRYSYRPNGGDDTLFFKSLVSDKNYTIPVGSQGQMNSSSTHAAWVQALPAKEQERLRSQRRPITTKVVVMDLATGTKRSYENSSGFTFSRDGKFVLIRKARTPGAEGEPTFSGTDAVLRNLTTGVDMNLGNVAEASFNQKSSHLALTLDAAGKSGNGIYLVNLSNGNLQALDTDTLRYSRMVWDDNGLSSTEAMSKGNGLAFMKGHNNDSLSYRDNTLVVFRNLGTPRQQRTSLTAASTGFPSGHIISEVGQLSFGSSGNFVFFGIRPQEKKPKRTEGEKANLDVWHWNDERIQSVQQRQLNADRNYTFSSALDLDGNRFMQMGDDSMRTVTPMKGDKFAVGTKGRHYIKDTNWGMNFNDYYAIDMATGAQRKIATEVTRPMGYSPDGTKFLYFQNDHIMMVEIATGRTVNLSEKASVSFVNTDNDYPYVKPAWGIAGWTKDGKAVLAYHKHDIYRVNLDGSGASNLTSGLGERDQIRFRYMSFDTDEQWIDTTKPMMLQAFGTRSKKSGFYRMLPNRAPEAVYFVDMQVGNPVKARNADVVMLTQQTFEQFPDVYTTNTSLTSYKKVTNANPQISQFAWGSRVLVDYKNRNGLDLQATLALPANYEPGKKYPMLVYFYDRMSDRHHQFSMPVYDDRPHMSVYASDGYLVLMPDIVYGVGDPGNDALDAISAAVNATIAAGYADPARIGLQGHSWGGYQSSYILTQTDMFAVIVTGAPPTNLESFYNSLYRSSGTVQHGIMEVGQVRLGATPWEDPEMYRRLSPVHQVTKIKTPFMILHGDEDGAVDWMQGLELYNAARRNGKEVIFLSYPGEPHHLAKKPNQIDFQIRMKQYFDHYLKGTPAPKWMTEGVSQLEKSKQ
jgi:acetyl esterase/lipase